VEPAPGKGRGDLRCARLAVRAVIDGLRLHYKDTGQGPAVLLWHGNFGSLDFYDGWVAQLVGPVPPDPLDVNGSGLSGPDEKVDFTIERQPGDRPRVAR
jgi:hypothetical protein